MRRRGRPHPKGLSTDPAGGLAPVTAPAGWGARVSTLPAGAGRPLVVTAAEPLLDDLLRVLAAAGSDAEVATGGAAAAPGPPGGAAACWSAPTPSGPAAVRAAAAPPRGRWS